MLAELLIIAALILLNGFFSGAEIAVLSVRKTRLRELAEGGSKRALAVEALRGRTERFLATVQVGITVISATAAAFGGARVAAGLTPILQRAGLGTSADDVALALVVSGVSFFSIVAGELVPKSLALRSSERYALLIGPLLRGLSWLATPAVWLLTASSNLVLRLFGDRTNFSETRISPEEIRQLVEEASHAGQLDAKTSDMATRAFDFEGLSATAVMVPRSDLVMLPKDAGRDDVLGAFESSGYARLPVYDATPENIIGHLSAKDVLGHLRRGGDFDVMRLLHPPRFLPENVRALDVLRTLQRYRSPLAFLVDEQGGLKGMITVEDLVEEIVGEIHSENEPPSEHIRLEPDGDIIVDGRAPVHDVNRELALDLPEGRDWTTVAGLAIALADQVPRAGARVTAADGTVLEVLEASPRRVHTLRLHPPSSKPPPPGEGAAILSAPPEGRPLTFRFSPQKPKASALAPPHKAPFTLRPLACVYPLKAPRGRRRKGKAMRNLLTTAALATALAACGGVDDRADQPSVLARVQGVVSNPQNLQVAGDLHLALVWDSRALEPDVTYEDIINHPLFVVSEDLPLTTSFPTNFTLSLTNPPPGEVVDDSVGVPPDESKGEGPGWHGVDARAAAGILVLYNDRNHNGRLDLVDIDDDGKGEFIDDVVGMAKRTEVFWFEAPLPADLHYPDAYGQPSAGFNVVVSSQDIFQADFYVGGWTFLFDLATPFAWQPLDSPVTIELSDDPVLDVVMCRKTMTGCLRRIAKSVKD